MPSMSGMLVPPDLDGLESSPSNGSTCSMLSQSKPASLPMKDVTSKDSHNSDPMTAPSMTGGIVESPPCTPQQTNRGLPMVGSNSGSQPVSTNTSPQQAPIRQMQRMRLHTMHSSPALVEKPMDMMYESYAHSPLFSHLHGMAPSGWPAAMGFAPNTSHPFSSMGMHAMATTAFINPSSTQVAGVPRGETGAYTPNNAPPSHAQLPESAKPVSPSRRRSHVALRAPRKAQSTPLFEAYVPADGHTHVSVPTSPSKGRSTPKVVRRLASHRRMSNQGTGTANEGKTFPGRLHMRGSMAALREASAMQASTIKGASASASAAGGARKPITLSFVHYGIEDAEELCSAVAPSGSYKVPLRSAKDSDEEGDGDGDGDPDGDGDGELAPSAWAPASQSSRHASPNEPTTPQNPSDLMPSPVPYSTSPSTAPIRPSAAKPMTLRRTTTNLKDYMQDNA